MVTQYVISCMYCKLFAILQQSIFFVIQYAVFMCKDKEQ